MQHAVERRLGFRHRSAIELPDGGTGFQFDPGSRSAIAGRGGGRHGEDAERFASGLGMVAGVLAPEAEIPMLLAKFGGAASAAQAIGNITAYVVAAGTASDTEGRQEVMTESLNTLKDMTKDKANDYFDKMDIGLGTALGGNSEELEKDYNAVMEAINKNGDVSIQTLAQTMGLNSDSLTALALNLAGPYITQQNGVLTLVSSVWNSPASRT